MANNNNQVALENAEKVIERFGGIRPMANKMRIPVTTVQGWKKRNAIPLNRKDEVMNAAKTNGIDLSDLPGFTSIANENTNEPSKEPTASSLAAEPSQASSTSSPGEASIKEDKQEQDPRQENETKKEEEPYELTNREKIASVTSSHYDSGYRSEDPTHEELMRQLHGLEDKAVKKSTWIATALVILATSVTAFMIWPTTQKVDSHGRRINDIEQNITQINGDLTTVKTKQGLLSKIIPEDFDINKIQEQTKSLQTMVGHLVDTADAASQVIIGSEAEDLPQRVKRLEDQVQALAETPQLSALLSHFEGLKDTVTGQETLKKALGQLHALSLGMEGHMDNFDDALIVAREESEELGKTFNGVSNNDLKAAAMLLGMTQVRSALDRGETPFEEDLQLLVNMVDDEDTDLHAALEKLAPKAKEGVLTKEGLSKEFKGLAGEIVVASLKGEDISVKEKAIARFNDVMQVEKNGELVTGTDTQATVARADSMLSEGNIQGAFFELQSLEGDAATKAIPFMDQLQTTLQAQQVKNMISHYIRMNMHRSGGAKYTARSKGFSSFTTKPVYVPHTYNGAETK